MHWPMYVAGTAVIAAMTMLIAGLGALALLLVGVALTAAFFGLSSPSDTEGKSDDDQEPSERFVDVFGGGQ
jgi:hypothetical protein